MALTEMGQPVAYDLPLPLVLKNAGWKVKIFDREIREPPHLTIIRRTQRWRINLRTRTFMDARPPPAEVPAALLQIIDAVHRTALEHLRTARRRLSRTPSFPGK